MNIKSEFLFHLYNLSIISESYSHEDIQRNLELIHELVKERITHKEKNGKERN